MVGEQNFQLCFVKLKWRPLLNELMRFYKILILIKLIISAKKFNTYFRKFLKNSNIVIPMSILASKGRRESVVTNLYIYTIRLREQLTLYIYFVSKDYELQSLIITILVGIYQRNKVPKTVVCATKFSNKNVFVLHIQAIFLACNTDYS